MCTAGEAVVQDSRAVYRVAVAYWVDGQSMPAIAARLGVSASTVSRMLKRARETDMVHVSLRPPPGRDVAAAVAERFSVTLHVAPGGVHDDAATRLGAAARLAAHLLADEVADGTTVAVAWGSTVSAIAEHLPVVARHGVIVVQLNGAVNARQPVFESPAAALQRFAQPLSARLLTFPVPAFFDHEQTRIALWRESSVRRTLAFRASADVAVFSVGAFRARPLSRVYSDGFLRSEDVQELAREAVVGDVCTVFLRADGSYPDISLNRRASGPRVQELQAIPRRFCVVSGENKVAGTLAALRAGVVTDLVTDEATAEAIATALGTAD